MSDEAEQTAIIEKDAPLEEPPIGGWDKLAWVFTVLYWLLALIILFDNSFAGLVIAIPMVLAGLLICPGFIEYVDSKGIGDRFIGLRLVVVFITILGTIGTIVFSIIPAWLTSNELRQAERDLVSRESAASNVLTLTVPAPDYSDQLSTSESASYQRVFTFSGKGPKNSEPFIISGDRFRINYDCKGALCIATLYNTENHLLYGLVMNETGNIKDSTIFYGSGKYYIDVLGGNFTMTVEDYK